MYCYKLQNYTFLRNAAMSFNQLLGKHKATKRRRTDKKKRRRVMGASGGDGETVDSSLSVEDRVRALRRHWRKKTISSPHRQGSAACTTSKARPRSAQGPPDVPAAVAGEMPPSRATPSSAGEANSLGVVEVVESSSQCPEKRTLALMFIVIDALPYEDIWRQWIGTNEWSPSSIRSATGQGIASAVVASSSENHDCDTDSERLPGEPTESNVNVRVFVHAKFPERVKSPWLREKLIGKSFKPEWGSVEITRAMLALVEAAIQGCPGARDMRLAFASESCLPIVSLSSAVAALWSSEKSWLDVKFKPRNGYNGSSQWVPIERSPLVPAECVCKSDQWVALTRSHAELVCSLPKKVGHLDMWQAFRKSCASDEMYFATLLCCAGILPDRNEVRRMEEANSARSGSISPAIAESNADSTGAVPVLENGVHQNRGVSRRKLTFVEWIYPDLDDYSGKTSLADRPVMFESLTLDLVKRARAQGCIFMRKFKGIAASTEWESLVLNTPGSV